MQLKYSPAKKDHAKQILEIENSSFNYDKLSKRAISYNISSNKSVFLVAEMEKEITAYALAFINSRGFARIYSIAVKDEYRGKGIGKQLFSETIKKIEKAKVKKIFLEVKKDNIKQQKLYQQFGFSVIREINNYYEDGATAYKMLKLIK